MNDLKLVDPFSPTDIYLSAPIRSPDCSNSNLRRVSYPYDNQIFLSKEPVEPVILIQGLRFYYLPSDICNYVLSFSDSCYAASLFLSAISPTFVLLLKTHSIESAQSLMANLKMNPNPICTMDYFDFQYVHSFDFKSKELLKRYSDFMNPKQLFDGQCPICLTKLTSDQLLFILPCLHSLHAKCMTKVSQWKCPICRDTPISSLDATCCEMCQSDENLFICLCCGRSFCGTHCHDHYEQKGHAYLSSADGRETWNMMSGSSMKRIAMDKSGEFVEMCAKEDSLSNYLDAALTNQILIHQSLGEEKKKSESEMIEKKKTKLKELILEKRKRIDMMKNSISEKGNKEKRLQVSIQMQETLRKRLEELPKENKQLEETNKKLMIEAEETDQLIADMERTCNISVAAHIAGPNNKIQVNIQNGNQPPPPPPQSNSSPSNGHNKRKRK